MRMRKIKYLISLVVCCLIALVIAYKFDTKSLSGEESATIDESVAVDKILSIKETDVTHEESRKNYRAVLHKVDGSCVLIDGEGNELSDVYDDIQDLGANQNLRTYQNGLVGFIDMSGALICTPQFSEASKSETLNGHEVTVIHEEQGYCYIDLDNENNRISNWYDEMYPFSETQGCYARVKKSKDKWYLIDKKFEIVDLGDQFEGGFDYIEKADSLSMTIAANRGGNGYLIDLMPTDDGTEPIIQEVIEGYTITEQYDDTYAIIESEDGMGVWLNNGKGIVIEPKYDKISNFYEYEADSEYLIADTMKNDKYGTINEQI